MELFNGLVELNIGSILWTILSLGLSIGILVFVITSICSLKKRVKDIEDKLK